METNSLDPIVLQKVIRELKVRIAVLENRNLSLSRENQDLIAENIDLNREIRSMDRLIDRYEDEREFGY